MQHRAIEILQEIVPIFSVNPFYAAEVEGQSTSGEAEMADYVEAFGRKLGLKVTRQNVLPGRDNVVIECRAGNAASTRARKTLLLEAHMDTVGFGSAVDPLKPRIEDGKMHARGACDTKATLAGMLYALECAARNPAALPCDVALLAAIDEEYMQRGARAFSRNLPFPIDGAMVGEPTELRLIAAHKGVARFSVTTRGRAAHSSVPHEGDSAIFQMMRVLAWLENVEVPRLETISHPTCGAATLVVGKIRGGTQVNIVPEKCEIEIDRRVAPGEDAARVLAQFETDLRAAMQGQNVNFEVRELLLCEPLHNENSADFIECAQNVARELGLDETLDGAPYATDASALNGTAKIPTVVFGGGSITQAHVQDEWIALEQVERAAEFYLAITQNFGKMD